MKGMKKHQKREDVLAWLAREKMTQTGWARILGLTRNGNMTVFYWIHHGGVPHDMYMQRIKERTPSCPILKGWKGGASQEKP